MKAIWRFLVRYFYLATLLLVLLLGLYALPKINVTENLNQSLHERELFGDIKPVLERGKRSLIFSVEIDKIEGDFYKIDSLGRFLSDSIQQRFSNQTLMQKHLLISFMKVFICFLRMVIIRL